MKTASRSLWIGSLQSPVLLITSALIASVAVMPKFGFSEDSVSESGTIRAAARIPFSVTLADSETAGLREVLAAEDGRPWGLAEVLPGPDAEGRPLPLGRLILLPQQIAGEEPTLPADSAESAAGEETMALRLGKPISRPAHATFEWHETSDTTLQLAEQNRPVLAYNFGVITRDDVPESDPRRSRSCYVHPLHGLDGEVLTDDFPKDHYHHHGVFWTWPHVVIDGQEYSLWEDKGSLRQRFVRWLCREEGATAAVLGVENGWFLGDTQVLTERVWWTVYRSGDSRHIDVDLFFTPLDRDVTLWGAEGKSYGGLTVRFCPRPGERPRITVADGLTADDLYETPLTWADLSSRFGEGEAWSGAAIFISPSHPDYPPTWLTRHYGPLCVGWPGIRSQTLAAGKSVHLPYRLWIHRDCPAADNIETVYRAYCKVSTTGATAE